eukprot:1151260-Pelagomonas_calceolata.AAC.5
MHLWYFVLGSAARKDLFSLFLMGIKAYLSGLPYPALLAFHAGERSKMPDQCSQFPLPLHDHLTTFPVVDDTWACDELVYFIPCVLLSPSSQACDELGPWCAARHS